MSEFPKGGRGLSGFLPTTFEKPDTGDTVGFLLSKPAFFTAWMTEGPWTLTGSINGGYFLSGVYSASMTVEDRDTRWRPGESDEPLNERGKTALIAGPEGYKTDTQSIVWANYATALDHDGLPIFETDFYYFVRAFAEIETTPIFYKQRDEGADLYLLPMELGIVIEWEKPFVGTTALGVLDPVGETPEIDALYMAPAFGALPGSYVESLVTVTLAIGDEEVTQPLYYIDRTFVAPGSAATYGENPNAVLYYEEESRGSLAAELEGTLRLELA